MIPFSAIAFIASPPFNPHIPLWMLCAISAQHFLQDRFALHLKWMRIYKQTPPEMWSTGPLCVDQAWHVAFLWLFATLT